MTHKEFIALAREFGASGEKTWWQESYFDMKRRKYSSCIFKGKGRATIELKVTYSQAGVYCSVDGSDSVTFLDIADVIATKNLYERVLNFMGRVQNAK